MASTLQALARAGIQEVVVILRPEKEDIPRLLGSGAAWGLQVDYVETGPTRGPVETLDRAYDRVRGGLVALALPDLLMTCPDPYTPLLGALGAPGNVDGVLGVFPATPVQPADPVRFAGDPPRLRPHPSGGGSGNGPVPRPVVEIMPKRPGAAHDANAWCWGMAVWSPRITEFIHREVARGKGLDWGGDWGLGGVFNRALKAGLTWAGVAVSSDPFLDIGTPEGLARARAGDRTAGPGV
jgi:hypothetical protein